ncbi:hypothetical protein LX64_03776 [Chitinophaga skermanii]|uniref:DUF3108 domain-containing protein n=1 Tax=Chitinophaga skermanii TaxID=331697 RepID=A0A327QAV0_9BACT|nr:hypothetical protein [Chitinophaga skermanii]RAJ01560.1 hypothetical protein LX64_03776 [Chitinophaga skermanii]
MQLKLLLSLLALCAFTPSTTKDIYDDANEWKVSIDDGWFTAKIVQYGPYTTSSKRTGVIKSSPAERFKEKKLAFNYTVTSVHDTSNVQVLYTPAIAFMEAGLPNYLEPKTNSSNYYYAVFSYPQKADSIKGEMILKAPHYLMLNDNKSIGVLTQGKKEFTITANNKFGIVNSYEKMCYEIRDRKKVIAAYRVEKVPKMWVAQNIDDNTKSLVAAAFGALLLKEKDE